MPSVVPFGQYAYKRVSEMGVSVSKPFAFAEMMIKMVEDVHL